MSRCPLVWIIMGVSGSGKSAIGRILAQKLECDFLEGDRRHPKSNITKMRSQQPLQDEDRYLWLAEIQDDIRRAIDKDREIVTTCSALKSSYRKQLTSFEPVQLIWLDVSKPELERRLSERPDHYMKREMLDSQLAAFEPINSEEDVIEIDGNLPIDGVITELIAKATQRFPSLEKPWWQRSCD
jgi:gluconokinase